MASKLSRDLFRAGGNIYQARNLFDSSSSTVTARGPDASLASFAHAFCRNSSSSSSSRSGSAESIKKSRAAGEDDRGQHPKPHERVNSTGAEGKRFTRNVTSESLNPDDGWMQFKEDLSPGSTDCRKVAAQKRKHPKDDVPKEVADKLEDETVDFIKKQSGMSGGATS
ncbi:hypothetical protein BV898_14498 [Hypsibius exemplaris]|uniref:Uncharacterized protein n=1 Tax=Hypsibius exemplaris TaxID=2072580 RepID=A0A9X6NC17_HYPEX|nr:hypothetical protein BV898_14498 [Hypsibius exemplaris]